MSNMREKMKSLLHGHKMKKTFYMNYMKKGVVIGMLSVNHLITSIMPIMLDQRIPSKINFMGV